MAKAGCSAAFSARTAMAMGICVSEQLSLFLRSIVLGISLGLLYDILRALRKRGGPVWGGLLDAVYCLTAVGGIFLFVMAGNGEVRLFILLGALGGAILFLCLFSNYLRPLWDFWIDTFLFPVTILKKAGKRAQEICKKLFSFFRKWGTMALAKICQKRPRQKGDKEMSATRNVKKKTKKTKPKKPSNKLTLLILSVLILGVSIQIYHMFGQLQDAKAEETAYAEQLAQLQESNAELQRDIDNSEDMDLISDIARNELGLASEGEKVFRLGK